MVLDFFTRFISKAVIVYRDERGQGMSEYGLILALVAIAVIGGLTMLGRTLYAKFSEVDRALQNPGP